MSRNFVAASSNKIENAGIAVVTTPPFTAVAWGFPTSFAATRAVLSVGNGNASGGLVFRIGFTTAGRAFSQMLDDALTNNNPESSTTVSTGVWSHIAMVAPALNDNTVYLNGGGAVNNTTATSAVSSPDLTTIGENAGNLSFLRPMEGNIAEAAIWNVALSVAEIASLVAGFSPSMIRPNSLVFYAPLIRDIIDLKGLALTASGTTVADHTRMIGL